MIFNFRKNRSRNLFHELPDHDLILKYRQTKNPEIIVELFNRYVHLVFGICLKYADDKEEAKDAVMEIFERLPEAISVHEIRNFKNWLYSVARNHCLMESRKKRTLPMSDFSEIEKSYPGFVEYSGEIHQEFIMEEYTLSQLEAALSDLKEQQRICLDLVYLQGKTYQEVSEMTGFGMNEVKSHVQNGKRNLKIKLVSVNGKKN